MRTPARPCSQFMIGPSAPAAAATMPPRRKTGLHLTKVELYDKLKAATRHEDLGQRIQLLEPLRSVSCYNKVGVVPGSSHLQLRTQRTQPTADARTLAAAERAGCGGMDPQPH